MIKLEKGPEPQILTDHADEWLEELMEALAIGTKKADYLKSRYRHRDIKVALIEETFAKCAYCESKILHTSFGDIEHVIPKSKDLKYSFMWKNLTLACDVCNTRKAEFDPSEDEVIDPYTTDPDEHLAFSGTMVFSKGTELGKQTKTIMGLNRAELLERRKERLESLVSIIEDLLNPRLPVAARKAIFADFKSVELARSTPYSAMANAFARQQEDLIDAVLDHRG